VELEDFGLADVVAEAARNTQTLTLSYPDKGDGPVRDRTVEPYSYREKPNGTVLFAFDQEAGSIKAFRLDRIAGVQPTGMTFEPRYTVEIA